NAKTEQQADQHERDAFYSWIDSAVAKFPKSLVGMPARLGWLAALEYAKSNPSGESAGNAWVRSSVTPPPVGVPVGLYTPGFGIEEFVNDGPEAYPDWTLAQSWWVALPGEAVDSGGAK